MMETRPLAIVTGGVKRLGAAIAGALAGAGYDLALSSHDKNATLPDDARLEKVDARIFLSDLSEADAPKKLICEVTEEFGRSPDLLVNNASVFGQDEWQDMSADTIDTQFAINFRAPALLATALAKSLPVGASANVVSIVDQRVRNPIPRQLSYTLSKQALAASILTLAKALGPHVRVNGVAPGLTIVNPEHSPENVKATREAMPLRRLPNPADIAEAVLYLANAQSVTGQLLFVDCGAHLKSFDDDFAHLE